MDLHIDPENHSDETLKTKGNFYIEHGIEFELEAAPTKLLQISPFQIVVASGNQIVVTYFKEDKQIMTTMQPMH